MAPSEQTVTTRALLEHIEQGHTGRIAVGAGSAEIALFLLDGNIVGCRASDDTTGMIDRLGNAGVVNPTRVRQLQAMVAMSLPILGRQTHDPILGLLSDEIGPQRFEQLLWERFEENVRRFVGHSGTPRFQDGVAPWCENVQVNHDTRTLLRTSMRSWERASTLDDRATVVSGSGQPASDQESELLDHIADGPALVRELLKTLDMEQTAARELLSEMLERGVIAPHKQVNAAENNESEDFDGLVSADDLDAFGGEEDRHRGGGGGTFVTEAHNLDRVELIDIDLNERTEPSASSLSFAAPTLTESDAVAKIEVANEVLAVLSGAIDTARGKLRGATTVQLLVDGRPRHYTALFEGIRVSSTGGLPSGDLLLNLRRRPATEQRRLLNQGMIDLLDRALDKAADELPEQVFDEILERVMGYRQRLGL